MSSDEKHENNNSQNRLDENSLSFLNPKNIQKDLLFFKDDILKDLRILENRLYENISIQKDEQQYKLNLYEQKIESQTQKIAYLSNLITESKQKTSVEENIEKFKLKTEEDLAKIDLKMNLIQKEIRDGLYKFDKLFSETILYPGIIGYECRFSNFHSFVDYVLSSIHQFIVFQELIKSYELHKMKNKMEKDIKVVLLQLKNNFKDSSKFTIEKINESETKMINILNDYNSKFIDVRFENNKSATELRSRLDDVANSLNKIMEIKNEIDTKYEVQDKKIEDLKINIISIDNKIEERNIEFTNIEKRFDLLTTYIDKYVIQNELDMSSYDKSRNNIMYKGRSVHTSKEYLNQFINAIDLEKHSNNNKKGQNMKKNKKYFFKGVGFIKRYITGKIGLEEMYVHPKDLEHDKNNEKKISPKIGLYKSPLSSEKKSSEKKGKNDRQIFSLTTVKSIKNTDKNKDKDKENSNKNGKESRNMNSNISLSLSKNNNSSNPYFDIKKRNQSYETEKNLSFSNNNDKLKTMNTELFSHSYKSKNLKFRSQISKPIRIDYVTRIPHIEINRVSYPDNKTKKLFKSLSDGNFNYSKEKKNFFEEEEKKKTKSKLRYNSSKSNKKFKVNYNTFGNRMKKKQASKDKNPNFFLGKPKKPLLIIQ